MQDRKVDITFPYGDLYVYDNLTKAAPGVSTRALLFEEVFNFFGGFLGWKKRAIPEIPQKTLEDWSLAGFSDLGEVDPKLSLLILLIVGYAVFASTKTAATPEPAAAKKHRNRKKKRR